jgi:hypothetical protein
MTQMADMSDAPFMEHPTGQYATAMDAMEAAIIGLRALPDRNRRITFCAQGQGASPDSIHFADVHLLGDVLETDEPVKVAEIVERAKVPVGVLKEVGAARYSIAAATPREAAQILDALFRHHLGIRPFPDEDNDYAVGAEW